MVEIKIRVRFFEFCDTRTDTHTDTHNKSYQEPPGRRGPSVNQPQWCCLHHSCSDEILSLKTVNLMWPTTTQNGFELCSGFHCHSIRKSWSWPFFSSTTERAKPLANSPRPISIIFGWPWFLIQVSQSYCGTGQGRTHTCPQRNVHVPPGTRLSSLWNPTPYFPPVSWLLPHPLLDTVSGVWLGVRQSQKYVL